MFILIFPVFPLPFRMKEIQHPTATLMRKMKSKRMRWAGRVARMEAMRNTKFWL